MHRWTLVVLTAVLGATLALPAVAQWKWRDAGGRTQYSDTPPPPSVAEKDILQRPQAGATSSRRALPVAPASTASAASDAPALAPKTADTELDTKRKLAEQDVADKKKAEEAKAAAARADNCARAKAQMRTFDAGGRVSRTNEKGEREFLDDKARAQEAARTRDAIASECK